MKNWLQHFFNPIHIMCRMVDALLAYDSVWRRIFKRKKKLTKEEIVKLIVLKEKQKRLKKETQIYKK